MLNLSVLVLRRANLSSLFSRLFERLACLERIDLSANSITNLPVGLLRNSPQLRAVLVRQRPQNAVVLHAI